MGNGGNPRNDTPRARAVTKLAVGAVSVVAVLFAVAAITAIALNGNGTHATATPPNPTAGGTPQQTPGTPPGEGGTWDVTAEDTLAGQAMVEFSVETTQPHTLSTRTAGAAITLPAATVRTGAVPGGFPHTPEGALAQLKALDETGMQGLDPDAYDLAWHELALPGAPASSAVGLVRAASGTRSAAGLDATGPIDGMTSTYQVDAGLIKGTADNGNFVVPCVLGELSVITANSARRAGLGDCQALRWVDGRWRISPTALPSVAACAWPGTEEAVTAGYRAVTGNA
jgi:hypothetical protein